MYNPEAQQMLQTFNEITNHELSCKNICGRSFNSIEDYTAYIENGGCSDIISIIGEV